MIDVTEAEKFVWLLTGKPDTPIVIQVFDDSKIRADSRLAFVLNGTIKQHAARLSKANDNGCGIFVQTNEGTRRGANYITAPRALFADDDATTLAFRQRREEKPCNRCQQYHSSELPPLITLPPTITVRTSAGDGPESYPGDRLKHFYWKLKPDTPLALWSEAQAQISCSLKTDYLINVDRVMRLPGTMNRKVDPQKGRDGTPFPVTIVESDASRVYDLAEVLRHCPDPIVSVPDITIDFSTGQLLGEDGRPIAEPSTAPPIVGLHDPLTPAAVKTASRVREWLMRQQIDFDRRKNRKHPGHFTLRRCVFNPDHLDKMAIIVVPETGAIWAGCPHNSCGSNSMRWPEIAEKISGWGQADPSGFRADSDAERAARLVADLSVGSTEPLVYTDGAFFRYSPLSGVWRAIDEATASRVVQSYDGRRVGDGENVKRLVISRPKVVGSINNAKDLVDQAGFFREHAPGITFANSFARVDEHGIRMEPFAAAQRSQAALAFAFDAGAEHPRFDQFLDEIFALDEDRDAKKMMLQEYTGAALLGFATRFESALFLTGPGANGKSTWVKIAAALFPEGTVSAVTPQALGEDGRGEYYRARLAGDPDRGLPAPRLNLVTETPENKAIEGALFKAVISGEKISARSPRGTPFDLYPIAAQWFVAQELPPARDLTFGFWRKCNVVRFGRVFTAAEQDKYLADYIIEHELTGIAAWAVEGARRLCARGAYIVAPSSEEEKKTWQKSASLALMFIEECCTIHDGMLPPLDFGTKPSRGETEIDELYGYFQKWCRVAGQRNIPSKHELGKQLHQLRDFDGKLRFPSRKSNGGTYYRMVVYNPPPEVIFN